MIKWTDSTSYRQKERGNSEPRAWTAVIGSEAVLVYRHIHFPGDWLLRSHSLGINNVELESKDVEEAKKEALEIVRVCLMDRMKEMEKALRAINEARGIAAMEQAVADNLGEKHQTHLYPHVKESVFRCSTCFSEDGKLAEKKGT